MSSTQYTFDPAAGYVNPPNTAYAASPPDSPFSIPTPSGAASPMCDPEIRALTDDFIGPGIDDYIIQDGTYAKNTVSQDSVYGSIAKDTLVPLPDAEQSFCTSTYSSLHNWAGPQADPIAHYGADLRGSRASQVDWTYGSLSSVGLGVPTPVSVVFA